MIAVTQDMQAFIKLALLHSTIGGLLCPTLSSYVQEDQPEKLEKGVAQPAKNESCRAVNAFVLPW